MLDTGMTLLAGGTLLLASGVTIYKILESKKLKKDLDKVIEHNKALDLAIAELQQKEATTKDAMEELTFMQKNTILNQKSELDNLNKAYVLLKERTDKVESQKKSSEVRLGIIGENFMPLISSFPYDHKKFRFMANPCDGIYFGDEEVVFLEFKTGNAKLSESQKKIRDIIKQGKVRFETFRVDDKGVHLKIESTMADTTDSKTGE